MEALMELIGGLFGTLAKAVKFLFVFFILACIVMGIFCTSIASRSCSKSNSFYPCQQYVDGKTNSNYSKEWFSCWRKCSPKESRIDPKTCECTCS